MAISMSMALFSLVVPKTSSAADNDQAHPPLERKEKGLERKRSGAAPCCVALEGIALLPNIHCNLIAFIDCEYIGNSAFEQSLPIMNNL